MSARGRAQRRAGPRAFRPGRFAPAMFLSPLPVLKSTTVSSPTSHPVRRSSAAAAAVAAPSGAQKIPVSRPTCSVHSRMAASGTASAAPFEALSASRMRKSPTARGTRRPDA